MADKFKSVNLSRLFNSTVKLPKAPPRPTARRPRPAPPPLPRGRANLWGIPFLLGPKDLSKKGVLALSGRRTKAEIPLRGNATHVCILHACRPNSAFAESAAGGEHVADYVLHYEDGTEHVQKIRRRFEINFSDMLYGHRAFAAAYAAAPGVVNRDTAWGWGNRQTGVSHPGFRAAGWIYALENPKRGAELTSLEVRSTGLTGIDVFGVTLYQGPGHPLRHVPRRVYRLLLPAADKTTAAELDARLDMGYVTRTYAVPLKPNARWEKAAEAGLGLPRAPEKPGREFLVHATGSEGATLEVKGGRGKRYSIPFGQAFRSGQAQSQDGAARLELVHQRKAWVSVSVIDESTGTPTPTRINFTGPNGEYLPPYGHHEVVNDNWFEDYGGDLKLGDASYAYVPGKFQIELPVGDVYVEINKGFEYAPVRQVLKIEPRTRQLELRLSRWTNQREKGWVTADTHVHFISPQTAWLEGQGEGLNLINLLASQWGKLFTNVADITGELSGCSKDGTLVWVGTENRHHLLGHISMLGAHGDPVFPMCAGGPGEAYLGDPDVTTLTEWGRTVKKRQGVAIRPHFPRPVCEEPVYFIMGQLDGVELRALPDPDAKTLDEFCFTEWYRYLNCGYRVAAVGGTDKMSAGMPVGGSRTYAKLLPDDEFSFENWGKAVRAGRTFTTSGPIIDITVDGRSVGEEIRMPAGGGTVEVHARAESAWPIHKMEVVVNGKVRATTTAGAGAKALEIKEHIKIDGSSWIAARCSSHLIVHHCWPIHVGAHTSPVYVVAGDKEMFSPSDATYMLTLIDGGMTWLDTLSVRYDQTRHRRLKAVFQKAKDMLAKRLAARGRGA